MGYDTSAGVPDTSAVDLENSYWINIAKNIVIFLIYLYCQLIKYRVGAHDEQIKW